MDPDMTSLRAWYAEYMAHGNNHLTKDSDPIKALESDDLNSDSFEPWIQAIMLETHVNNGFCGPCRWLFDNWPSLGGLRGDYIWQNREVVFDPKKFVVGRSGSTAEIEASTRMGCNFCAYLLQRLKDSELLTMFRKIEWRLHQLGETSTCALSIFSFAESYEIQLNLPNKFSSKSSQSCYAIIYCSSRDSLATIDDDNDLTLDIFAQVNKWLHTCCDTHKSCNTITRPHLPTRLVSLLDGKPRVILTTEIPRHFLPLRYATLSYCWGKTPFIKLKSDNIDALTTSISLEDIPKTFADAFGIASQLAIDYIWIDSLCIIQDDENDWEKEAELMQLVYSGSYINIAATSATDVYQGLFLKPPTFSAGFCTKVVVDGIQATLEFTDPDVYVRAIARSHLMTRAWAIQEKILPPRTLHIGDRGFFWECKQGFGSEYIPRLVKSYSHELLGDIKRIMVPSFWQKIVGVYSAANLTFRSDKLRALAGMARAVFDITGDEYLSGIWRADIELHLCWHIDGPRVTQQRLDCQDPDWTAPSWSWASIDGKVIYYVRSLEDVERYGHVFETGPISSKVRGFERVSRRVLHLRCSALVAGRFCDRVVLPPRSSWLTDDIAIDLDDRKVSLSISVDCIDDSSRLRNEVIYLLPLVGDPEEQYIDREVWHLMGVVLRKTAGSAGEYCRIGHFDFARTKGANRFESAYWIFKDVLKDVGAATAEAGCVEVVPNLEHPSEKYIITII